MSGWQAITLPIPLMWPPAVTVLLPIIRGWPMLALLFLFACKHLLLASIMYRAFFQCALLHQGKGLLSLSSNVGKARQAAPPMILGMSKTGRIARLNLGSVAVLYFSTMADASINHLLLEFRVQGSLVGAWRWKFAGLAPIHRE